MADSLVIRAGHLFDPATGELHADRRLVVRDGRVATVLAPGDGDGGTAGMPSLDCSSLTVVPGLIDAHSHLIGELEGAGIPSIGRTAAAEALDGVANARATLHAGFTTVRDVGTYRAFLDVDLREAIDSGRVDGPRMQCAGAYITSPDGGGEVHGLPDGPVRPPEFRVGVATTPAEVRTAVNRILDGGADLIKLIVTGAVLTRGSIPGEIELGPELVEAAVDEASRRGRFVAAHAHGAEGIRMAARAGVRSIEHGSLLDDEGIELLVRHGTWLVADIYDGDWIAETGRREGWPEETLRKNDETTDAQRAGFSRAVAAGVRIAYGTDSGVYPHGRNAIQLAYMVRHGMTPAAALASATVEAARLLGWEDRVGSLAPGRFADLVAVDGDPLADIDLLCRPVVVTKGGSVVRDDRPGRGPLEPG
jgi:imidazolonepropionase-like amidohydrolase